MELTAIPAPIHIDAKNPRYLGRGVAARGEDRKPISWHRGQLPQRMSSTLMLIHHEILLCSGHIYPSKGQMASVTCFLCLYWVSREKHTSILIDYFCRGRERGEGGFHDTLARSKEC